MSSEAASDETQLRSDIGSFVHDPLKCILYMFPWGDGELADSAGPRRWQRELLVELGEKLKSGELNRFQVIQYAISSGHGIGKSALVAWLILWAMSTFEDTRGVVTANTENQLKTKTWAELAKWHRLAINRHWFTYEATAIFSSDPTHAKTWRIDMVPWNETKTEAFAGLHNKSKRLIIIFDEASAIPDSISQVTEGALTDEGTEILWFKFGNPTRNTGHFRECFGRMRHRWIGRQIDSRTVEGTNKDQLAKWVEDYGEDSDFVRVRVRGLFPNASTLQFIPSDLVATAMKRDGTWMLGDPLVMSLDIARGGDDSCVFAFRRGLDARSIPWLGIPGSSAKDSMVLAAKAAALVEQHKPDAFIFDETGIGGPVGDRLRQLGVKAIGVGFGDKAPDPHYANMRSYMWGEGKAWLARGGILPNDPVLETDLISPEFHHDRHDRVVLESKEDMKARGLASPDWGDAWAMLFAYHVAPTLGPGARNPYNREAALKRLEEFDLLR